MHATHSDVTDQRHPLERPGARAPRSSQLRWWPGSLRGKTLLIISATMLGMLLAIAVPLRLIVLASFVALEEQDTRRDVERAANAIADNLAELSSTARDYSSWDETYAFIQGGNPGYVEANFGDETFETNGLSLVLLLDAAGQVVYGKAYDLAGGREEPLPERLRLLAPADRALLTQTSVEGDAAGILLLADRALLLAARPILTSAYEGPVRGTLVMGRALDDRLVRRLAESTRLTFGLYRADGLAGPPDLQAARVALRSSAAIVTRPLDDHTIAGYTLLRDLAGAPALLLRTTAPRAIVAQGITSTWYFMLSLLVAGAVFGGVSLALLKTAVLDRLTRVGAEVRRIGVSADLAARVQADGDDELACLARDVNAMLDDLEHTQALRRRAEEDRERMQEELARAREHFMQMTVHDLKTPLTAVIGYLDMLAKTSLDEMQRECVEGARRGGRNLLNLVQDTLDAARLEEGRLALRRLPCDVRELLHGCAADLQAWAAIEDKPIRVEAPEDLPPQYMDVELMRRVLMNLISNALKHTPPRTAIVVGAALEGAELRLWVEDDGPGIPPEVQARLFERFSTGTGGGAGGGKQRSHGLGLTFCKLAVEAHGGALSVRSAPGQGACFTATVPQRRGDTSER
ncbi:MAG TPA: CHASE4 domain-containing protein [Roseiflexaceae bacterium]|nr:CHASE4 domain-containing protein [Roseiflexaceae bacterium]